MPIVPGTPVLFHVPIRRFECQGCGCVFREDNPIAYPHAHVTRRLATWVRSFMGEISIKKLFERTAVGWDALKRIQKDGMLSYLDGRRRNGYSPRYLAVDVFATHRGHSYSTSVMDVETGWVLWVGGRKGNG